MGSSAREFLSIRMSYIDELFSADHNEIGNIETLLKTAALDYEEKRELYNELKGYIDSQRAEKLIEYLLQNQVDPISAGHNYSQSQIKNKLKRET